MKQSNIVSNSLPNLAFSMITTTRQRFAAPFSAPPFSDQDVVRWSMGLGIAILLLGLMTTLGPAIATVPLPTESPTHTLAHFSAHFPGQWFNPAQLTDRLIQCGAWGPALYIGLLIVSVVISQLPGAPLAVAAGAVWGPFTAGVYTVIGGFGGALVAYSLGRWIGPAITQKITGKKLFFTKQYGAAYLGGLIFATRLLPILSFDLISYGAGMARLSFPIYASATFLGMLPSTFLLTYAGGSIHWGGGAFAQHSLWLIALFSMIFATLFISIPVLFRRLNCLDIQKFVRWE